MLADEQSEYRGVKDKKPLTLEKKEHETLTLGKKATRAWEKNGKRYMPHEWAQQQTSASSVHSVVIFLKLRNGLRILMFLAILSV